MGTWRLIVSPDLKLSVEDPNSRLLIEWIIHRLIPDLKTLPFDFVVEIRPPDDWPPDRED